MGPPPTWTSDRRHGRMDVVRSLLRPPPPRQLPQSTRSNSSSSSAGSQRSRPSSADSLEWSEPTFTRVRARPNSLYSRVRASPTFPLSRVERGSTNIQRTRETVDASSPGFRVGASTIRSQASQGTQTETGGGGEVQGAAIRLGAFGDVGDMTLETVNFLIRVLEDRRQDILVAGDTATDLADPALERQDPATINRQARTGASMDQLSLDASQTSAGLDPLENREPLSSPRLTRSHSYEALVRLEGILESRHQQLMKQGLANMPEDVEIDATKTGTESHPQHEPRDAHWSRAEDEDEE